MAIGLLLGIAMGLCAGFLREFMDATFSDESEITTDLKLPVLASIPVVTPPKSEKAGIVKRRSLALLPSPGKVEEFATFSLHNADTKVTQVVFNPMTVAGEQYRLVRASLSMMQKQNGVKSILIASAIPNEGKSFVAACLAGILAQETDKSVLLVHADMRTASGSKLLGVDQRKPLIGLSEVLQGTAHVEDALLKSSEINLYFLPAGKVDNDPTDLLSRPQFENLLRDASRRFDWVIIDSPPVLALADANLMVPLCDAALLVVRAGKTPANLVKDSIQRIGRERISGVLLNGCRSIKTSHYYKHYYPQIVAVKKK
jgi:capsular exopolysaccharide synthesis family protein